MSARASFSYTQHGESVTLMRVGGEIDVHTLIPLCDALERVMQTNPHHLVLNLLAVRHVDSSIFTPLLKAQKRMRARDGVFAVVAQRPLARLFRMGHLELELFDTEDEAMLHLRVPPAPMAEASSVTQFEGFHSETPSAVVAEIYRDLVPHITFTELIVLLSIVGHASSAGHEGLSLACLVEELRRVAAETADNKHRLTRQVILKACLQLVSKGVLCLTRDKASGDGVLYALRFNRRPASATPQPQIAHVAPVVRACPSFERRREAVPLLQAMAQLGISRKDARELVTQFDGDEIHAQLLALPWRRSPDPAETFVRAVRERWPLPDEKSVHEPLQPVLQAYLGGLSPRERAHMQGLARQRVREVGGAWFHDSRIPDCLRDHFVCELAADRVQLLFDAHQAISSSG